MIKELIYVRFSCLDFNKLLLHEFHYNYGKRKLNASLLFRDKNSIVYETEAIDVDEDFHEDKYLFHFTDYSPDLKFFDHVNNKAIAKMKDHFKGKMISEFVGLK